MAENKVTIANADSDEHYYLISRTSFDDYLGFMSSWPVGAADADRRQLADEWRAAKEVMRSLRTGEAGCADRPPVQPLPRPMQPLLPKVYKDPIFRKAFSEAPTEIGLVELDRLVVSQKLVNKTHLERIVSRLGPTPSPEAVFRYCLPYDHPTVPHRVGRVGDHEYAFVSDSNDLRFLGSMVLRPEQISGWQAEGPVAGVIGLVVGYSSNFLYILDVDGRLIVNNGHHRACALRSLGLTHAPCVILKVSSPDELEALGPRPVRRNREFYLKNPRPPVLKDYFNPKLSKVIRMAIKSHQVRVRYSVEGMDMP